MGSFEYFMYFFTKSIKGVFVLLLSNLSKIIFLFLTIKLILCSAFILVKFASRSILSKPLLLYFIMYSSNLLSAIFSDVKIPINGVINTGLSKKIAIKIKYVIKRIKLNLNK